MSRHTIRNEGRRIHYGFDRPCSEYFAQAWPDGMDSPVDSASGGAGEVMDFLKKWGVTLPEEHLNCLAMDLPIEDDPQDGGTINAATYDAARLADTEAEMQDMDMPDWLRDAIENIDAGIYSSDTFIGRPDLRAKLREYFARWERGLRGFDAFDEP